MSYIIGSKFIELNWKNWVQGMTTANSTDDGGFAPGTRTTITTSNINPLVSPGILNFPAVPVDKSTGLTGQIIAGCEDTTTTGAKLFVSTVPATGDGEFYTAGSDGTLTSRGTDNTVNYIQGKTDIVCFDGEAYFTSDSNINRWQLPNTFNAGATYPFAFNDAFAPHPALVYENNAYFGDGNELLRLTAAGGTPAIILTLPANQVIVALGIDPGSGLMLISVIDQYNLSGTLDAQPRILYYDGFSNKARKVVLTDEMVTCFYNVGGTVFIGYGQNFGYWTGTGVQFLRKLYFDLDSDQLLYKHHISNIGNVIFIAEKMRILAFGEIIQGQGRSWWYAYQNFPSGTAANLTFVSNMASNKLCFSYATSQFFTLDISSASNISNSSLILTKNIYLPRDVTFNALVFDFNTAIPINTDIATVSVYTDDAGNTPTVATIRTAQTNQLSFQITYPTISTRLIQIQYSALNNLGLNRILVFYNPRQ